MLDFETAILREDSLVGIIDSPRRRFLFSTPSVSLKKKKERALGQELGCDQAIESCLILPSEACIVAPDRNPKNQETNLLPE